MAKLQGFQSFLLCVFIGLMSLSPAYSADDAATQVRTVLENQAAAWNRGDIPGFMAGYEDAETTTFVGSSVVKGYRQVLDRYLQRYSSKAKMGQLTFSDLEIHPLGSDHASAIGRWKLVRSQEAGGDTGGLFTLLLRRTPAGWRIILDHTS